MQGIAKDIVLIIEEEPGSAKLYSLIFRNEPFDILYATSISGAKEIMEEVPVKIIISDIINLRGDIVEFFEHIEFTNPLIKRIIISDYIDSNIVSDAVNRGRIYNYMRKPIDPKKLIVTVKNALNQYNLAKHNEQLLLDLRKKNVELHKTLKELSAEEEKFRNLFNSSADPIIIIAPSGKVLLTNTRAKAICNNFHSSCEDANIFNVIYSDTPVSLKSYISDQTRDIDQTIEVFMESMDTDKILYFELKAYPLKYKFKHSTGIILRDISLKKELENKVIQTIIQTEEKERRRFAQELHDGIGPLLSTTKLYLQWLNKPDSRADKKQIVSKMEETLEETVLSVREISNNLSPKTLTNFGLGPALQNFIKRISTVSAIEFNYNNRLNQRLNEQLEITIYRLICELINNSVKHAEAQNIDIEIIKNEEIDIIYSDDGIGFNVEKKLEQNNGAGLINLSTRVLSLGGLYNIESSPGNGTKVYIRLNAN
ncbi:histidine kinase [Plebeiibacterium marinum]|uniref:histidine kinase n=1 Tax=Plebeiibacterium marinum TaxID=2992111 RepID=A0AAE3MCG5_9BACT|nr:histidine kinase [Plebeiobacterium marinum]MCW3805221.1 histidine kinase [Plebeiobacterium marinum]